MSMPPLTDVATEAAAGKDIMAYLEDRGIRTSATLALMASDSDHLQRVVIDPLMAGWKKADGTLISIPEIEKPIATAIIKHMHAECRRAWANQQQSPPPTPVASTATSSGSGKPTEEKAPKQLPRKESGASC